MSIFSKSKGKDELTLVFSIGSSYVGGALFLAQSSGIPKVVFSTREPIPLQEKVENERFLSLTIQSLDAVVNKIYAAGLGAPKRIFCVLSSPWLVSQTRIISLKKNTSFIFNTKLADELIQKEIKIFEEQNLAKYPEVNNGVRAIELKNIKTTLNGYETSQPLNQKAKELEMTVFVSISGEQVLKKIENTINRQFHLSQIKFSSFTMATFTVVRDRYPDKKNFLLVYIGGEVTDISMIKNGALRESISFPLGCNFLTRGVAASMGCTLNEANSLISAFRDGHAEESVAERLKLIMDGLRTKWIKNFQESLANLSNDVSIPATVFIDMGKDLKDFFSETIKTEQFSQYTLTESKFEIMLLSAEIFLGLIEFEKAAIREPFLVIDAIYINRFLTRSAFAGLHNYA
jgi:hypothetical protein